MNRTARLKVFGTAERVPEGRRLAAGPLSFTLADGALSSICWHGSEILRGIAYPVRDADWGTYPTQTISQRTRVSGKGDVRYQRDFSAGDQVRGRFSCEAAGSGQLTARVTFTFNRRARVNRAGFVLLHPIVGTGGAHLAVTHTGGRVEQARFPASISPSQPVRDIAALRQVSGGVTTEIRFSGETFEMEDQRNWSDASFKSYCRPLSWPRPYEVDAGEVVEQSIVVTLSGAPVARARTSSNRVTVGKVTGSLPSFGLAIERGWEPQNNSDGLLDALAPAAMAIRIDLSDPDDLARLPSLAASVRGDGELEIIVSDEPAQLDRDLKRLGVSLGRAQWSPKRITALPRAFLKSYQPEDEWPAGTSPEAAVAAARRTFRLAILGSGMLTNFTELNRYRSALAAGDFVTHGTTAIVHAADDLSVVQTLECLPHIFRSVAELAHEKPYRLGLVSIGARSNPYGVAPAENRAQVRRPMAIVDPRQRGLFAAAWMLGAVAATEGTGVQSMLLAAPCGPFGLIARPCAWPQPLYDRDPRRLVYPAFHVFRALTALRGKRRTVDAPSGTAALAAGDRLLVANLGMAERSIRLPRTGTWAVLDVDSFDAATREPDWLLAPPPGKGRTLVLGSYATAFVTLAGGSAR